MDPSIPIAGQLKAYNARDIDAFIVHFTKDLVVEDGQGKPLLVGREALYDKYKDMFTNYPKLHCNVVNRMRCGQFGIDEERISGRGEEVHCIVMYTVNGQSNLIERLRIMKEEGKGNADLEMKHTKDKTRTTLKVNI
jgi:hypothetical protein